MIVLGVVAGAVSAPLNGSAQTAAPFDRPPATTEWAPVGCRVVPFDDPVLPSRESWRNLHGDSINTDEISRAIAPVIAAEWTAEPETYNVTGPVLDDSGNLYFSPFRPYENVVLISVNPDDGSRRWAIAGTGAPPGGSAPMVLDEPSSPGEQRVYLALYDRALSVSTDGAVIWDVPTRLSLSPDPFSNSVLGVNYHPGLDAIVAATVDGFIYALDRATGAQLLDSPFQLPGENSPDLPGALPPAIVAAAEDEWQVLVNAPDGSFSTFVNAALGEGREVANMFSIDPHTGRLWVAATAPDAEDGTVDGVSEFGALYGLDIVPNGESFQVTEACHASFQGGSASTPALRADGSRVYVADNFGKLLAVSATDCSTIWEVDVGQQIVGSVGVSSDNNVIYAPSRDFVTQVFDQGGSGVQGWQAGISGLFEDTQPGHVEFKLNLNSVGANALGFQAATGPVLGGIPFPVAVGVGTLDRQTGAVRYFTDAVEESVAVISSAADGAIYIGNSPVRRAFAIAFGLSSGPLRGGVTKYAVQRHDLLMRDAACAAAARAANASDNLGVCSDSAQADGIQMRELVAQIRNDAAPQALTKSEVSQARWDRIDQHLTTASTAIDDFLGGGTGAALADAADELSRSCSLLDPCPRAPRADCKTAQRALLLLRQKGGTKDKLLFKWLRGEPVSQAELGDPTTDADYALCMYTGAEAAQVESPGVLSDGTLWSPVRTKGYRYKDTTLAEAGVRTIILQGSSEDRSRAKVKGKGSNLPDPTLPLELPVVAQLINGSTGVCLTASFVTADVLKNEASQFKAKIR